MLQRWSSGGVVRHYHTSVMTESLRGVLEQLSFTRGDTVHRKLVLVIDDCDAERELYGRLLWYNGFDVIFAVTGEEGIQFARERAPDLVVLDLILPGMGGIDVCQILKEQVSATLPVLVLSARSERELGHAAREAGCDKYLEKPISPVKVLFEVERLIGRPPPSGELVEQPV